MVSGKCASQGEIIRDAVATSESMRLTHRARPNPAIAAMRDCSITAIQRPSDRYPSLLCAVSAAFKKSQTIECQKHDGSWATHNRVIPSAGDTTVRPVSSGFPLAVDPALSGFGVPGALHRDLRGGAFDLAEIVFTQLDG